MNDITKETKEEKDKNIAQPKEETVQVSKTTIEAMQKTIESMKKTQDMLLSTQDKKQLALYFARNKDQLPTKMKLRMIGEKVIVGWSKMMTNDVYEVADRRWKEDQTVNVLFEDGKTEEMTYMNFVRRYTTVMCTRMGIVTDEKTGSIAYKLIRDDNAKEYIVDATFVN